MMINLSLLARLQAIEKMYMELPGLKEVPYATKTYAEKIQEDDKEGEGGNGGSGIVTQSSGTKSTSWEDWVKGSEDTSGSGGSTAKGLRGKNDLAAKARRLSR